MKTEHIEEQIGCGTNSSCCKSPEVPSDDEVAALNDMREIKARVGELKKRLAEISSVRKDEYRGEKSRLEKEMTALKAEWNELAEKREKAAHERMVLLGHEKI